MPLNFQTLTVKDLSKGIDARSTEDAIPEGFSEDLINVESNSEGWIAKRRGYQGYYGYMPMRVVSVDQINQSTDNLELTLDSTIDISALPSSPLVVYGKLSSTQSSGDWTLGTNNAEYYTDFTANILKTLETGSTPLNVLDTTHGVTTDNVLMDTLLATNSGNRDNTWIATDGLDIDKTSTYDVDINYSGLAADINVYMPITNADAVSGSIYVSNYSAGTGSNTENIAVGTHGLSSSNIIVQVYLTGSSEWDQIFADGVTIDSDGDVDVTIDNSTGGAIDAQVILSIAAADDVEIKTIDSATTNVITSVDSAVNTITLTSAHNLVTGDLLELTGTLPSGLDTSTVYHAFVVSASVLKLSSTKDNLTDEVYIDITSETAGGSAKYGHIDTIVISTTNAYNHWSCYQASGADLVMVLPHEVSFDDDSSELTVTIWNSGATAEAYHFFHKAATLQSNKLIVTQNAAVSGAYTGSSPQLTVWGIPHAGSYNTTGNTEGHTTHIDTYRSTAESRVIAGLGGNIFGAYLRTCLLYTSDAADE